MKISKDSHLPVVIFPRLPMPIWHVVVIAVIICLPYTDAFRCHSCSYSYTPEDPDADDACVHQPEIYTGYQQLKCEHNCVVQETYNKRLDKVVAYWRHCADIVDNGHCRGDPTFGLVTCLYTCTGDLCNTWVKGQLHTIFSSDSNNGNGGKALSPKLIHLKLFLIVSIILSRFLVLE